MLSDHQMKGSRNSFLFVERARRHTQKNARALESSFLKRFAGKDCKQNPGRLRSEFKVLPNGADLQAKVAWSQQTARNSELPKAKFKCTFLRAHCAFTPNQCTVALGAWVPSPPRSGAPRVQGYTRSASGFAHSTHLPMTPSATCPQPPSCRHPAHVRVQTHTHTLPRARVRTHTHTPSPQLRPEGGHGRTRGHGLHQVGGAGRRGPTGAVTADAEPSVPGANSSRPRGFPPTRRPPPLPFGREAPAPAPPRVSPEPRNVNRDRRGGRGGSSFFDFPRRNSSWTANSRVQVGGAPQF